jgi:hypothetical protein
VLQQQARFDDFITRYNTDRPHQALAMKCPRTSTPVQRACIAAFRSSPNQRHRVGPPGVRAPRPP